MKVLVLLLLLALSFPIQAQLPNTIGEQRVLVILVNFQDKQEQQYTPAFAQDVVFNQVNSFYLENSYNQTWLTGDVYGWFTIASSYTTCDPPTIAAQAKAAAQSAGANLSNYSSFIYAFPSNACQWFAIAPPGQREIWIKGLIKFKTTTHEFGHGLGLWHSKNLDCGPEVICSNGTVEEYGDIFDMMANADTAHFNLYQKERLGWVNLTTVTSHGDYTIDNYETITTGSKGLKIAKSPGQWYYVEKRSAYGFDSYLSSGLYDNVRNGVLLHLGKDSSDFSPYLLDTSPPDYWAEPALVVAHSFVDAQADLGITLLSVNPTVVRVTCAACVPPPDTESPTVTITSPVGTVPRNTIVNIQVSASDNVGVDRVEVLVNNVLLCSDSSSPYSCSWNVPGKRNASYTLTAKAYDAYGNIGTHSVVVVAS